MSHALKSSGCVPHSWKAGGKPPRLIHCRRPGTAHLEQQRWILTFASTRENHVQSEIDDSAGEVSPPDVPRPQKIRRQADSTDWVSSQLTRRFGYAVAKEDFQTDAQRGGVLLILVLQLCSIAGGLVWLGVLAFGVISEQIKTRLEDSAERENTKVHRCSLARILAWVGMT